VVKNYVTKDLDLGLYAVAEEYEKGLKKCQVDINRYYQPESTRLDQRKKAKMTKLLKSTSNWRSCETSD